MAVEVLVLTTPIAAPSTTTYAMIRIDLNRGDGRVLLAAKANTGQVIERLITGAAALTLLHALNTVDLSVKSLERRALEYMAGAGDFDGVVSGTPL